MPLLDVIGRDPQLPPFVQLIICQFTPAATLLAVPDIVAPTCVVPPAETWPTGTVVNVMETPVTTLTEIVTVSEGEAAASAVMFTHGTDPVDVWQPVGTVFGAV